MPRATRRNLAQEESTPTRSSPRASTKASTAASSSPTKTRGRRGEKAEEDVKPAGEAEEPVRRGRTRPASRGKAAESPAGRQSRSRGRGAAGDEEEEKTTPPSATKRGGRGRAKAEVSPQEEEVDEVEQAEEQEEVTPKTGRGRPRGRGRGKSPATTPSSSSRASRSARRSGAEQEEVEKTTPEKEAKTTPTRGRGRGRLASSRSRSRPGRGAADKESVEEAEEMDTSTTADVEEKEESDAPAAAVTKDAGKSSSDPKVEEEMEEASPASKEEEKTEETKMTSKTEEDTEVGAVPMVEEETEVSPGPKNEEQAKKPEPELVTPQAEAEKTPETEPPAVEPAEKPVAEAMDQIEAAPEATATVDNGAVSDKQELKKLTGVKRKLEEEEEDEEKDASEQLDTKRARVNGEDAEEAASATTPVAKISEVTGTDAKQEKPTVVTGADSEIPDDFVVVNKEDVPAADSSEVAAALPQLAVTSPPAVAVTAEEPMDTDTGASAPSGISSSSSTAPGSVTVIPLTEAEMAKAYANELQAKEREDRDEISSTVVEVGSVAGSDVTGLSRGLDTSELQSGSNSIDGDFAGDTSITEAPTSEPVPEAAQPPATCQQQQQQVFNVPAPVPANPAAVVPNPNNCSNNGLSDTVDSAPPQTETAPPVQVPTDSVSSVASLPNNSTTAAAAVPKLEAPPCRKGASSVSERLGTPDPTFLATYASPSIFNRAKVPNPAVPADSVDTSRTFSVVSYNILAECARLRADYSYTAPEFLGQEYRHGLLMRELQYLNGDVVCLQEVNPAYFNTVLLPEMQKLGYDGTMIKRTKEPHDEGEATFYRTALFELENRKGVPLTEVAEKDFCLAPQEVEAGGLSAEVGAAVSKYLDRADVVLITKLRSKVTGKCFTVGNIHVVWDSMRSPDVQCIQAACAIKEVVGVAGGEGAAHIICGDFNSEWSSPAYQLVLDGYLSDASIRKLQAVERLDLSEGSKSLVNHLWRAFQHTSSNLRSAYSTVTGSEPEITTYTSSMHNSVDYIFFSSGSLVPVAVWKTVDRPVVDATNGLPDRDFPSDHLSMKALMAFTD